MILVDDHPGVQAVDHKIADLKKRRAEFERNVTALAAEDLEAQRVYDEALGKAMRDGAPAPEPLVLRLNAADIEARYAFIFEERTLTEERQRAMAAAFPDVLKEARSQVKKLVAAAGPQLEKLTGTMGEVGALLDAVRSCRDAQNATDPSQHQHYHDRALTLQEFIRIVSAASDPLDLVDLGDRPRETWARDGMVSGGISQLSQPNEIPRRAGMVSGGISRP